MTAPQTELLGQLLNQRYRIIEPLGSGGFSRTYLAEDTQKPDTPKCVIKHLRPASNDPTFLQTARRLFKSEAEALKALGHHDQIPELFEAFEENREFYLAQEFIDGYPLNLEMAPGQRWSEEQVLQLLQEVLAILTFVHGYGVIHRDLKPDNIICRQHDNKLVLIDFGSVKQIQTQLVTPQGHLSATVAVGTPGYLSSEQGQGKPRPNSDIYSLGLIGIQALTGLHPTQLQDDPETGEKSWRQHVQVSDGLAYVLDKMVRYYHKDRYPSTEEAQRALQQVADGSIVLPAATPQTANLPTLAPNPNPEPIPVLAASANPATYSPHPYTNPPRWHQVLPYANMIAVATVIAAAIAFNLHQGKQDNKQSIADIKSSSSPSVAPTQPSSPQSKPPATPTKVNSTNPTSSTPVEPSTLPADQSTLPPTNTLPQSQTSSQPISGPNLNRATPPPERPMVRPTPPPKSTSSPITKKPNPTTPSNNSSPCPTSPLTPIPIPSTPPKSIAKIDPFNFVHRVVYERHLKSQGIPGGSMLISQYQTGSITAEDVVKAGVAAEALPPGTELDKEYIRDVDRQLEMLRH